PPRRTGMTIHSEHPFADPEHARDSVRRLRGRLVSGVTLWCAGSTPAGWAGLTVSSLMVANGEPPRVLVLLDPLSDLTDVLGGTAKAAVSVLAHPHRALAEQFAGQAPAPGGRFAQAPFSQTGWGPVLASAGTWAGVRVESTTALGWSNLVTCVLEHVELGDDTDPLIHFRGRYPRLR
ncbi:MAG: flavin reductase family protein, partial [Propionicimonas sp.]